MAHRGSRKHVLDWTGSPRFAPEFLEMLAVSGIAFTSDSPIMPLGYSRSDEARLERFGPDWLPGDDRWAELEDWWLVHKRAANTPNWDICIGGEIEGRPGLVLVEAKANKPELGVAGKKLPTDASERSRANHEQIGRAIVEACAGWQVLDTRVAITRDSHYQLSNRLAFTWKLASMGLPVVLVYLGFTGDAGISDAGEPFADNADWQRTFAEYAQSRVPLELFDGRLEVNGTPVWLLSRSREVLEPSPSR